MGQLPAGSPRLPEIDGLRGVAIALIVVYHIWLNRVSGGVDVFFLISGFLVTMSLLRMVDHHGRVRFAGYYARVIRRIAPPALVALVGVVLASVLWLPQTRWRDVLGDVVASALYMVNWRLAENAVDYLAAQNAASPAQHYWSLAVQGQFYLIWPVLVAAAALAAARLTAWPRQVLAVLLGAVVAVSLTYSVVRTGSDQTYTYFDTFARLWEFALGGLLLLALPYLRPTRSARRLLGWAALLALVVCGLVFRAGREFPGWAALWPTLAAATLIVCAAGDRQQRAGPDPAGAGRLLSAAPLRWLGGVSYALYLWHWPVLVCYLAATDRPLATARGGLFVLAVSIVLAIATKRVVEDGLPTSGLGQRSVRGGFTLAAGLLAVVLLATVGWTGLMAHQLRQADAAGRLIAGSYPGAAYLAYGGVLPDVPYRPSALEAKHDRPRERYPGCHQNQAGSEVIRCEFGPAGAGRMIVVVGGSRAQHWLPALEVLADQHRWRVVSMTKSSCLFSAEVQELDGEPYSACTRWNENVLRTLAELAPDAVFTTSTRVTNSREFTPDGYVTQWRGLAASGIPVLGVRDIPRASRDVPECVERYGPDAAACTNDPATYGLDRPADVERRTDIPGNVRFLDLTDYFCAGGRCPPVIGNVLVYHDRSHMTVTYARTLAPFLGAGIIEALASIDG